MLKNIKKSFASLMVNRIITVFKNILIIPIMIKYWGINYYGEWVLLTSAITFITMSNIGIGTSIQNKIVSALTVDGKGIKQNSAGLIYFNALIINVLLSLFILSILLIVFYNTDFNYNFLKEGENTLILLVISFMINMISKTYKGYWIYYDKYDVSINYDNILAVSELCLYAIFPILRLKAIELATGVLILNIIWFILYACVSIRKFNLRANYKVDQILLKEVLIDGLGFQLSTISHIVLYQTPLWIIGLSQGSSLVAIWGTLRAFTRVSNQIIEIGAISAGAEILKYRSKEDFNSIRRIIFSGIIMCMIVSIISAITYMLIGGFVFKTWSNINLSEQSNDFIWVWLALSLVLFSIWRLFSEVLIAENKPWFLNIYSLISAIFMCLLIYYYIDTYGLLVLAFGIFLYDLMMVMCVPRIALSLLNIRSLKDFFLEIKYSIKQIKLFLYNILTFF